MKPAIEVERVSKVFRSYARPWDRVIERLGGRPRHRAFAALDEVSFEVPRGEAIGIVGENGAGKSTLLKILAGITSPSSGRATVEGTIAAILELGSGFHPEFTGRQNVALNAAMLGLDGPAIASALPHIIDFSELGDFIDEPVKHYSTGMAMRLAFSIAIQVRPNVLIVDEALSVGDGYFQKKCIDSLRAFLHQGGTLLFCSHAMYYVSSFCRRALWLRGGKIAGLGLSGDVVPEYEAFLEAKRQQPSTGDEPGGRARDVQLEVAPDHGPLRIDDVCLEGDVTEDGSVRVESGSAWSLTVRWRRNDRRTGPKRVHVAVGLNRSSDGIEVCAFGSHEDGKPPFDVDISSGARLEIPDLGLVKGAFDLYVFLLDEAGLHIYDQRVLPARLTIRRGEYGFGLVSVKHRWRAMAHELDGNEPEGSLETMTA